MEHIGWHKEGVLASIVDHEGIGPPKAMADTYTRPQAPPSCYLSRRGHKLSRSLRPFLAPINPKAFKVVHESVMLAEFENAQLPTRELKEIDVKVVDKSIISKYIQLFRDVLENNGSLHCCCISCSSVSRVWGVCISGLFRTLQSYSKCTRNACKLINLDELNWSKRDNKYCQ